jgi:hypothetical protein
MSWPTYPVKTIRCRVVHFRIPKVWSVTSRLLTLYQEMCCCQTTLDTSHYRRLLPFEACVVNHTTWVNYTTTVGAGRLRNWGSIPGNFNSLISSPQSPALLSLLFSTTHCSLRAYCAILVRRSNFRHQASPRVSTRESTQRRKVELFTWNVW